MNSVLSSRTQSAQPVAFITALVVTALLLLAAIPALAQAQEPTPTPEQQEQPAPTQEPTPTTAKQEGQPAPTQEPTPTPEKKEEQPAPTQEPTPTPEKKEEQPAPTQEPTPTPEKKEEQPAPTQEPTNTVRAELSFSQTAWSVDETDADGALTITVNINPALTEAGSVNIKTSPNAAADARVPATLALPAGQTSVDLPITVVGDDDVEGDESFEIELSAGDGALYALGAPAKTTITIIDDDRPELTVAQAPSAQSTAAVPQKESESSPGAPQQQSDAQGAEPQNEQIDGDNSDPAPRTALTFSQTAWSADEGDGELEVTVNIDPALPAAGAVNITTHYGSASAADVSVPKTLALPAGATSAALRIPITADSDIEAAETFDIELVAVEAASYELGAPASATITINDDDRPVLSLAQAAYTVNEAEGVLRVVVNMSAPLPDGETPQLNLVFGAGHTATRADLGADSDVAMTTVETAGGYSSLTVAFPIAADTLVEGDETFGIEIVAPDGAPYELGAPAAATVTITDDVSPVLTFEQAAYTVDEAAGTVSVKVNIDPALPGGSTLTITPVFEQGHTATHADINEMSPVVVTLASHVSYITVKIPIADDTVVESDETFALTLSVGQGIIHRLGSPSKATITIVDDDLPVLTLDKAAYTVNEADGVLRVVVEMSAYLPDEFPRIRTFIGEGDTATAADIEGSFHQHKSKVQTADGYAIEVDIPINDDDLIEEDETFSIELVAGASYELGAQTSATVTIVNDDRPALSFAQAAYTVNEEDGVVRVIINMSPALPSSQWPSVETVFGQGHTATYRADVGTNLELSRVESAESRVESADGSNFAVDIPIMNDTDVEGDETFAIALKGGAHMSYELGEPATATITIVDDDDLPILSLGQATYTVREEDSDVSLNVEVSYSKPLTKAGTLLITARHLSTSADDFAVVTEAQLPKDARKTVFGVTIRGDNLVEADERFEITLAPGADARFRVGKTATATVTIVDDDLPVLSLGKAGYSVDEDAGWLTIPVRISPALEATSAVSVTTRYGTAGAADVSVPATLTLPQGATSADLRVAVSDDNLIEGAEKFEFELVAVNDAPYELGAQAAAAITINDNDLSDLSFEKAAYTVNEGDGQLDVIVKLSPALKTDSQVNISVYYDGAATADDVSVPATLTLPKDTTSVKLAIAISEDTLVESAEKFEIGLSAIAGAPYKAVGQLPKTTITIEDNDKTAPQPQKLALQKSVWTITVTPGDQALAVSWKAPPGVKVDDISEYRVVWCLEAESGCNPTTHLAYPKADGTGSYTITRQFSPASGWSTLTNGARYRVYVRAVSGGVNTILATSEFSYDNRPQAPVKDAKE